MAKTKKSKILIAEDEKSYVRPLSLKLKNKGYEVETAGDGKEALSLLKKNKYNLLLLDLIMPGMDGFELMKEIKDKKLKVKIIVLSNLSQETDKDKASKLGASDFISKSNTSLVDVLKIVEKNLGS